VLSLPCANHLSSASCFSVILFREQHSASIAQFDMIAKKTHLTTPAI
jgi:hypothetical protein